MEIFRFSVSLRLHHPALDPNAISAALEMTPSAKWKAGEIRRRPDGTEMGGVYPHTYWASRAKRGEDAELLQMIETDLEELEKKQPFLAEFCSTGGWIDYYVSWFCGGERSGGETIPYHLLQRLAALRIGLALDVYSFREGDPVYSSGWTKRPGPN